MATKIQGITIEIGGDTSPLAKALSSLNKSINSTQSELKAVDKALKLSPDSVVLLAQKQKLLESQIESTSEKIRSLKQIEQELQTRRQADPSNENLEKQLRAVQRELSNTESGLRSIQSEYKSAGDQIGKLSPDSVVLLAQKQKLLESQIESTSEKIRSLKQIEQELQTRRQADPSNENLEKQLRAVQRELSNTESGLRSIQSEYKSAGDQIGKLNDSLDESSNKHSTFKGWISNVVTSLKDFVTGNKEAGASASESATEINSKIEVWNRFAGAVSSAAQKLFSFITSSAEKADDFNILSAKTGIATDELQKLTYASQFVDVSVETMTGSISKLINNMDNAKNGTGTAAEAFDKLKIKVTDAHGQLRNSNEVFYEVIDKLGSISNETERDAIAMDIFGRSARELNPLIVEGSARLKELGEEAENAGIIMSQDALDGAAVFNDTMDKLKLNLQGIATSVGADLAESLTGLLEAISPIIEGVAKLISLISKIPTPVLTILSIIITLVATFSQVTKGVSAAKGAIELMNPAMWKTVGIIMAVVTALIAVLALIVAITGKKDDLTSIGGSMKDISDSVGVNAMNNSVPRYANGTNYHPGGAAYITEYAPEQLTLPSGTNMVVMPRGTKVNPNVTVGAGGGDVFNISINARDVKEINDIVRMAENARQQRRAK